MAGKLILEGQDWQVSYNQREIGTAYLPIQRGSYKICKDQDKFLRKIAILVLLN